MALTSDTQPRIHVRHCEICNGRLTGSDVRENRCASCRSTAICPDCRGFGAHHYQAGGAPESELCVTCMGEGRVRVTARDAWRQRLLAAIDADDWSGAGAALAMLVCLANPPAPETSFGAEYESRVA